ncbi:haloacid dehalogenase [Flavobacterium branchiophilum]|nr:haloacid dehalogenase [Flavobacterium branchiophilum] [Flavobacterium branchiophilum NBRC 15030 = ATCC 35035]
MMTAIIFDFGDVLINLNRRQTQLAFEKLGLQNYENIITSANDAFEKGTIDELTFLETFQKHIPNASLSDIKAAWNTILGDFPTYRLDFLKKLSQNYDLYLLSNTDAIHIAYFESQTPATFVKEFYQCFKKIYFSFDLKMRKPDLEIYQHVLQDNGLNPKKTLFIDDKKANTDAAAQLGISVWNLQVGQEDVVSLFEKNLQ